MLRTLSIACLVVASGCGDCGSGCRGSGSTSFVRCMDVDPPSARRAQVHGIGFSIADRGMTLDVRLPIRIAAFRGAGDATTNLEDALSGMTEHGPHLVLVLGGLGTEERKVEEHLRAFAKLEAPTLVLAGGDDVGAALDAAWESGSHPPHVIDARGLRTVRAGSRTLALVSGAPLGRYAWSDDACGVAARDLDALRSTLSGVRAPWLVSWAAPSGGGANAVGRGFAGIDAGDDAIRELARDVGAQGGVYAFPSTRALAPTDGAGTERIPTGRASASLSLVVARASGAPVDGLDGALVAPAISLLELTAEGVAFLGTVAPGVRDLATESGRSVHPDAP